MHPVARRPFPLAVSDEVLTSWLQAKGDKAAKSIDHRMGSHLTHAPAKEMWAEVTRPRIIHGSGSAAWSIREDITGIRRCASCNDLPSYGYYRLATSAGEELFACGGCLLRNDREGWRILRQYYRRIGRVIRDAPYWIPYLVGIWVWLEKHRAWRGMLGGCGNAYTDMRYLEHWLRYRLYLEHNEMMLAKAYIEGAVDTSLVESSQDVADFSRIVPTMEGKDARMLTMLLQPEVARRLHPRKRYVLVQAVNAMRVGQPLPRSMKRDLAQWYLPIQLERAKEFSLGLPSGGD